MNNPVLIEDWAHSQQTHLARLHHLVLREAEAMVEAARLTAEWQKRLPPEYVVSIAQQQRARIVMVEELTEALAALWGDAAVAALMWHKQLEGEGEDDGRAKESAS